MSSILTVFNDHFIEFVNDVHRVFPDDPDILSAKNGLTAIRKMNPKLIVKIWKTCIVAKYDKEIENGNIDFFVNKDYSSDLSTAQNSDKIIEAIDRLREPIKNMEPDDLKKTIKYIQNLTKLSKMCE